MANPKTLQEAIILLEEHHKKNIKELEQNVTYNIENYDQESFDLGKIEAYKDCQNTITLIINLYDLKNN